MKNIPERWIMEYVDQLPEGPMRQIALLRAEYAMDLVRAWRDHDKRET